MMIQFHKFRDSVDQDHAPGFVWEKRNINHASDAILASSQLIRRNFSLETSARRRQVMSDLPGFLVRPVAGRSSVHLPFVQCITTFNKEEDKASTRTQPYYRDFDVGDRIERKSVKPEDTWIPRYNSLRRRSVSRLATGLESLSR